MKPLIEVTGHAAKKLLGQPHLAALIGAAGARGELTAIVPGTILYIVTNPNHVDGILPLKLTKVSNAKLEFETIPTPAQRRIERIVYTASRGAPPKDGPPKGE